MKIKYLLLGIFIGIVPLAASANIFKDLFSIAKEVKKYDDNSRANGGNGVLSPRNRARLDAMTSSGLGGKALVGASIATDIYEQITKKDVSNASKIFDNAINNYNSNNKVIEEHGWNNSPNPSSAINAIYSVGSAAYEKSKEKDIEKANNAFFEMNKIYTDPNSSYYDPYFYETLKYDKNGRITGRMDTYDRVNTIKELSKGRDSAEWESVFNSTVDKSIPTGVDRNTYIKQNEESLKEEALAEIAEKRKENMKNYYEGKYNTSETPQETNKEPEQEQDPAPVEVLPPNPITISGYELNAVDIDSGKSSQLDEVYSILSDNPDFNITILGHTCDLGNDTINDLKGKQRAENAKAYLVNEGISESRITVVSKGAAKPIVENSSIENRKLNRRIEIVFTK